MPELRPHVGRVRIIARQFAITQLSGTIARGRRQIPRAGDPVTRGRRLETAWALYWRCWGG